MQQLSHLQGVFRPAAVHMNKLCLFIIGQKMVLLVGAEVLSLCRESIKGTCSIDIVFLVDWK